MGSERQMGLEKPKAGDGIGKAHRNINCIPHVEYRRQEMSTLHRNRPLPSFKAQPSTHHHLLTAHFP